MFLKALILYVVTSSTALGSGVNWEERHALRAKQHALESKLLNQKYAAKDAKRVKIYGESWSERETKEESRLEAHKQLLAFMLQIHILKAIEKRIVVSTFTDKNPIAGLLKAEMENLHQKVTTATQSISEADTIYKSFDEHLLEKEVLLHEDHGIFLTQKLTSNKFTIKNAHHYLGFYERVFKQLYSINISAFITENARELEHLSDDDFYKILGKISEYLATAPFEALVKDKTGQAFVFFIFARFGLILDEIPSTEKEKLPELASRFHKATAKLSPSFPRINAVKLAQDFDTKALEKEVEALKKRIDNGESETNASSRSTDSQSVAGLLGFTAATAAVIAASAVLVKKLNDRHKLSVQAEGDQATKADKAEVKEESILGFSESEFLSKSRSERISMLVEARIKFIQEHTKDQAACEKFLAAWNEFASKHYLKSDAEKAFAKKASGEKESENV